jgi:hypothetical protein
VEVVQVQVSHFEPVSWQVLIRPRQHPRDLFDIKLLLENEGLSSDLRKTFLVYLISHHRPIAELIAPNRKNIRGIFEKEFLNMTTIPVST